ncbi:dUTP diphosphatase [Leptolyngbya sp. AN03gr2]|uniref:dUTP diphosphatase n=1 Tax=Leptolyngbya sp. AN03gr2 TaxID=3423364 RepID=UPI003D3187F7
MINADIVLRSPEFQPETKHDGDAGGDLRAFIQPEAYEFGLQELADAKLKEILCTHEVYIRAHYINGVRCSDRLVELAQLSVGEHVILLPGEKFIFDVGFKLALRSTDYPLKVPTMLVVPRSGLACKYLVGVANSPGVIDQGYRNWVGVCLENRSSDVHIFTHGARIAQALFVEVANQRREGFWNVVEELPESGRGVGGFGSTGV